MCGFLGEFCFNNSVLTEDKKFLELLALSKHRGPDSSGHIRDSGFQLGFNRLAILDVSSAGNQPKQSQSGRYLIVFNGEVYNFKSLIKDFNLSNLPSTSDTEVIISLLDLIGIKETFSKLDGMFAIAVIDKEEHKLYLTRDFAGIKPHFYSIQKQGVVFASQFDQVFKHEWCHNPSLDPKIVKEYFGFGYMQAPNTVFIGIKQLCPGEMVVIDNNGNAEVAQICSLPKFTNERPELESVEAYHEIIRKIVDEQMVSDVPIGSFLSGGIDSPLITSIAKSRNEHISAFTIGVDSEKHDESKKAEEYAMHIDIEQEIVTVGTEELLDAINAHFDFFSEPFGDYSSIPTYLIAKKARETKTVMLSGDGGDELFFGYPRMIDMYRQYKWFKIPYGLRKAPIKLAYKLGLINSLGPYYYPTLLEWLQAKQLQIFPSILDEMVPDTNFSSELNSLFSISELSNKNQLLQGLRWSEFYGHLQRVLIKVDRASMGSSLEVRVPFLGKKSLQYAWKTLPSTLNKPQELKKLLKKCLSLYIPKAIIEKKKKGFTVPIDDWLKGPLKEEVLDLIVQQPIFGEKYIDADRVRKFVTSYFEGNHTAHWGVWHIYAWQKWAKKHVNYN